jgi:6-pyruvoyltetrahydropterin/6-carboxytetrahydropterin synthase
MVYEIAKEFHFDFGHRVWSQELEEEYALTSKCKCRFLHGHTGRVIVYLVASNLQSSMVTDFNHLSWLKKFIDDNIDHKFIIDRNDPLFDAMLSAANEIGNREVASEYDESFYIVDFVPTSENLAKWVFELVQEKMEPLGVEVSKVEWCETPKTKAAYGRGTP